MRYSDGYAELVLKFFVRNGKGYWGVFRVQPNGDEERVLSRFLPISGDREYVEEAFIKYARREGWEYING